MKAQTFVLVHGAWHNAYHWRAVAAHLRSHAAEAICVELPGHGARAAHSDRSRGTIGRSSVADVTIEAAALDLLSTLRRLGQGRSVVVAHSIGGIIVSRAAELDPGALAHLVYVSGHVPLRFLSLSGYASLPEWSTGYGRTLFQDDPAITGVIRINPTGPESYLEDLRAAYYNDVSFEQFQPFTQAMTPDLPLDFWLGEIKLTPARWGQIPRSYVRCLLDRALSPAIQTMMIADADSLTPANRFRVLDLQSSHSPFASQPETLAECLLNTAIA